MDPNVISGIKSILRLMLVRACKTCTTTVTTARRLKTLEYKIRKMIRKLVLVVRIIFGEY